MICVFISFKLKELIITAKKNEDLTHTIQTILQVFPEGVLIRSLDETSRQTILKFANNIAKEDLVADAQKDGGRTDFKVMLVDSPNVSVNSEANQSMYFSELLSKQENVSEFEDRPCIEQMIKVKKKTDILKNNLNRNLDYDDLKEDLYFNVKSIRV